MKLSTRVKPISYLKRHAAEIVKNIPERREPMLITRNGEAELVVMDVKSSEEHEETLALLKLLALGNREIGGDEKSPTLPGRERGPGGEVRGPSWQSARSTSAV